MSCDNHAEMNRKHEEHQRQIEALAARVSNLEQESARYDEKIDRIFADIDSIKDILAQINISIEAIKSRPTRNWDLIVAVGLTAAATYFVNMVIK